MRTYKLNEFHEPVPDESGEAWRSDRKLAHTRVDAAEVSTVFLVLDHNFSDQGAPILFETMVFGGPMDQECERYCTWTEAQAGHAAMVERVRKTDYDRPEVANPDILEGEEI